jgi:hypothetical protein
LPNRKENKIEKLSTPDTKKIMENLIEKISKKYSFEKDIPFQTPSLNQNIEEHNLYKTRVFENLMNKADYKKYDEKISTLVTYFLNFRKNIKKILTS